MAFYSRSKLQRPRSTLVLNSNSLVLLSFYGALVQPRSRSSLVQLQLFLFYLTCQIWSDLVKFGPIWSYLVQFGPIWSSPGFGGFRAPARCAYALGGPVHLDIFLGYFVAFSLVQPGLVLVSFKSPQASFSLVQDLQHPRSASF